MRQKLSLIFLIELLIFICSLNKALAHRVIAFASFDGENVTVEGYFPGGDAIKGGEVKVIDSTQKTVSTGKTDSKGFFSFKPHGTPPFTILIKAGPGHLAKTIITPGINNEMPPAEDKKAQDQEKGNKMASHGEAFTSGKEAKKTCNLTNILNAIQAVRQDIDQLRKEEEKVRMRDIIGGIGYIFGIMGILALIKAKRSKS